MSFSPLKQLHALAMTFLSSIVILPLIQWLEVKEYSQSWYADGAASCRPLSIIHDWWIEICSLVLSPG